MLAARLDALHMEELVCMLCRQTKSLFMDPVLCFHYCELVIGTCRAGFIVVDLVLAVLVAAYMVSVLAGWAHSIAGHGLQDSLNGLWAAKVSLLLDCLTCAAMVTSEFPQALYQCHRVSLLQRL